MKNRNIQFERAALCCKDTGLLLACLAAVFISTPTPVSARDLVPFNGTILGYLETQEPIDQCTVHAHVVTFGNSNQLGAFTGTAEIYGNFCENPPNITSTGSYHWFAANGDQFSATFDAILTPTATQGVYDNHETAEVTGGTGRFTNATGHRGRTNRLHHGAALVCPPLARDHLKCRLDEAVDIVRLFCASQLAFV